MKRKQTATRAVGRSAPSGSGEAFWRRATGRTTVGLVAVAALALVGPAQTFAAPVSENGPAGAVEALGGISGLANQVATANAQLADLNTQLAAKRESVNKTIVDLQRARAAATTAAQAVISAQKALKWADDKIVAAQKTFDSQAALAYTEGSAGGGIASYLSAASPDQLLQRGQALALVSQAQQMTVDTLKRAHDEQSKRVESAKKKQDDATAAQQVAEQRKNDALAAIAAVQHAAAAQAAKAAVLTQHRDAAQAAIAGTTPASAPATTTTNAATPPTVAAVAGPPTTAADLPTTAAAAPATDVAAVTPAAATAATTDTAAPAVGGSDWVSLLMELMNSGSAGTGSAGTGSAGTGSGGTGSSDSQNTPQAVNQAAPATTTVSAPLTTVTSTPAAATTTAAADATTADTTSAASPTTDASAGTTDATTATTDTSEYYEGDGTVSTGDNGLSQAPTITGSAGVETVVNRAMSQLGVTYAWGGGDANGPTLGIRDGGVADSYGDYKKVGFDCSGLMVYAFAGVGLALPHYSGYQYTAGKQVPIANVQRGDMIFWGPGGNEHVALYLGDGKMLEAMESGTVIHVTDVRYGGIQPYAVRLVE